MVDDYTAFYESIYRIFQSGILGFGGGPSSVPLVHKEVVGTFKWMNKDELSDVLALGNTLRVRLIQKRPDISAAESPG
jgi:chromate transport protein ChrA